MYQLGGKVAVLIWVTQFLALARLVILGVHPSLGEAFRSLGQTGVPVLRWYLHGLLRQVWQFELPARRRPHARGELRPLLEVSHREVGQIWVRRVLVLGSDQGNRVHGSTPWDHRIDRSVKYLARSLGHGNHPGGSPGAVALIHPQLSGLQLLLPPRDSGPHAS